jgi:hypothetical protein
MSGRIRNSREIPANHERGLLASASVRIKIEVTGLNVLIDLAGYLKRNEDPISWTDSISDRPDTTDTTILRLRRYQIVRVLPKWRI